MKHKRSKSDDVVRDRCPSTYVVFVLFCLTNFIRCLLDVSSDVYVDYSNVNNSFHPILPQVSDKEVDLMFRVFYHYWWVFGLGFPVMWGPPASHRETWANEGVVACVWE